MLPPDNSLSFIHIFTTKPWVFIPCSPEVFRCGTYQASPFPNPLNPKISQFCPPFFMMLPIHCQNSVLSHGGKHRTAFHPGTRLFCVYSRGSVLMRQGQSWGPDSSKLTCEPSLERCSFLARKEDNLKGKHGTFLSTNAAWLQEGFMQSLMAWVPECYYHCSYLETKWLHN